MKRPDVRRHQPKRATVAPIHDRLLVPFAPKLASLTERIIDRGITEGVFTVPDPGAAAWFVLGGLHVQSCRACLPAEVAPFLRSVSVLALYPLGYTEAAS